MRLDIEVDASQLQAIDARLAMLPRKIADAASAAVKESGEAVRERVVRTVRVHTGRARDAIRVRLTGSRGLTADVGWFDRDTYYMQFNEFGTSSIAADPVLTRAAEEERGEFPRRVHKHIEGAL